MSQQFSKKNKARQVTVEEEKIEITLQDVIQYLNINPTLLLKEQNAYTAERLMMLLDNEKLAALEEEFGEHQNGIKMHEFIWLMKCAIVHKEDSLEKYELVNGLIKLFQDIDINDDKQMEWSEFTQYIIDAVIGEKEAKFVDQRFDKEKELTETEVLDKAYSRKTKRYIASKNFDNSTHTNLIKKTFYSETLNYLFCLEQYSNKIKFYSPDCQEILVNVQGQNGLKKKLVLQLPTYDSQPQFIIDFTISESQDLIAIITSDRQVLFYDNQKIPFKLLKSFKLDVLQTGIWYLDIHKCWITAGADNNIRIWNINDTDENKKLKEQTLMIAHLKQITDICELKSPKLIASASLDGSIKLWDISDPSNEEGPIPKQKQRNNFFQEQKQIQVTLKTELKDPSSNQRGVRGLTYSFNYGSNLLSFGFDNHINVWCPEVSITRAFIGKLEGHSCIVVQCKFITNSPNVISVDEKCNVRIWDIRGLNTIQVLANEQQNQIVNDLSLINNQKYDKFIISGKRLNYFENVAITKSQKSINEEITPIQTEFNSYYNFIVILTKIDMRCYDAITGRLKKVFNEIHDQAMIVDLCLFCFGGRQRKFYLADNAGQIRQYNMKNGEYLKTVNRANEIEQSEFSKKNLSMKKKELNEVTQLIYITEEKLLISAYSDSTIRIYDESEGEESTLIKVFCGGHNDLEIYAVEYCPNLQLLASGGASGFVTVWEIETGKVNSHYQLEDSDVSCITFCEPYPIIFVANQRGIISILGLTISKDTNHKNNCLLKINHQGLVNDVIATIPITNMILYKHKLEDENFVDLYLSDNQGFMFVLDVKKMLETVDIHAISIPSKKQNFQLHRKDLINASKQIQKFMTEKKNIFNFQSEALQAKYLKNKWKGHKQSILNLAKVDEPLCLISSSQDKCVKFWKMSGQIQSFLNISKLDRENNWVFPFDWVQQKIDDINLVFDVMMLVDREKLSDSKKDEIKLQYLLKKYFDPYKKIELTNYIKSLQKVEQKVEKEESSPKPAYYRIKKQTQQQDQFELIRERIKELKSQSKDYNTSLKKKSNMIDDNIILERYADLVQYYDVQAIQQKYKIDKKQQFKYDHFQKLDDKFGQKLESHKMESDNAINLKNGNLDLHDDRKGSKKKENKMIISGGKKQKNGLMESMSSKLLSTQTLLHNNQFVKNLTQVARPTSMGGSLLQDVKYRLGESTRSLRIATNQNQYKIAADSQNQVFLDNQVIQQKQQFYKQLFQSKVQQKNDANNMDLDDDNEKGGPKSQSLVASNNFLQNPTKNNHIMLKTKNKIIIVDK